MCLHLETRDRHPFPRKVGGYELPRCLEDEADHTRFFHRDVPSMTDDRLYAEQVRAARGFAAAEGRRLYVQAPGVLAYMPAEAWLKERLDAIARERRRRKGSSR